MEGDLPMACFNQKVGEQLERLCAQHQIKLLWKEPMSAHTSFRIGGPAAAMAVPADRSQLAALLQFSQECAVPYWIIGNGSNMLVSDQGLDGIAILLDSSFEGEIVQEGNLLIAPAGKHLSAVCAAACQAGLTGLEFAWGIPGSIGGAVDMNAGAYGGELKDRLVWVEYLNEDGQVQRLFTEQLGLSYRHSCFMEQPFLHGCILRAAFALEQGDRTAIEQEMERIITQRREKQPLEYPSAGSTFKRPQGAYASQLIDQCGLRGLTVGGAQVSKKHAGFVVNIGGATCADVLGLVEQVKDCVKEKTGFVLEMEVRQLP